MRRVGAGSKALSAAKTAVGRKMSAVPAAAKTATHLTAAAIAGSKAQPQKKKSSASMIEASPTPKKRRAPLVGAVESPKRRGSSVNRMSPPPERDDHEAGPDAPENWEALYAAVVKARQTLQAPVDTIGCNKLQEKKVPKEHKRYQTLIALMLSAQTRDQMTAQASKNLIEYGCNAESINKLPEASLKKKISMVGFANKKSDYIKATTRVILEKHNGIIPKTVEELCKFPGVGPKMAHLFVQSADGKVEGIGVDVHVHRIAQRWNWVPKDVRSPEDTRKGLERWMPRKHWRTVNEVLVGWGQVMCLPRFPKCAECPAAAFCPAAFTEESEAQKKKRLSQKHPSVDGVASLTGSQKLVSGSVVSPMKLADLEDIGNVTEGMKKTVSGTKRTPMAKKPHPTSQVAASSDEDDAPKRKRARKEPPKTARKAQPSKVARATKQKGKK